MRQGLSDDEKEAHVKEVKETMSILNSNQDRVSWDLISILGNGVFVCYWIIEVAPFCKFETVTKSRASNLNMLKLDGTKKKVRNPIHQFILWN